MFVYIAIGMGTLPTCGNFNFVYTGFLLGFAGILVVGGAIACGIGLGGYTGVSLSLISAEVLKLKKIILRWFHF